MCNRIGIIFGESVNGFKILQGGSKNQEVVLIWNQLDGELGG